MEPLRQYETPTSRSRTPRSTISVDEAAPIIPWATLHGYLKGGEFQQGDHVAVIGPTGSGKTHIAFEVADIRAYVILVALKPQDPLIEDARKKGYYLIPGNKLEIEYVDGRPLHPKVIYWPRLSQVSQRRLPAEALLSAEKELHKQLVRGAIGYVRKNKRWTLILDEGTWVCRDLNLQRDVDSALMHFRSLEASVIILGQRPSWMGRYVLSSPTHLFLFSTNDANDRKSLGEISGVDTRLVQDIVGSLDFRRHEVLYINTRTREMYRTIAPPR